ncbi:MAG TPA: CNNM domain-containing protein, partial [Methanomassiliicoccales archaeon]|nr:CNNM domain-containing protein [Methanomassiliicoccales archaeon]
MARALGSVRRLLAPSPLVLRALIIGLAVRLLLAPWTSYPYDAYPFYGAVVSSLAGTGPYGNVLFTYPPLFSAILFPFFWSVSQFMDPASFGAFVPAMIGVSRATGMIVPFVTSPAFNLLFKLPIIVGDMLVALTLHRAVDRWKGREAADTAFLVWFLNPLVIFVSSVHGQFDALAAYCGLVGTLGFMDRRYLLSGLSLGLGVLLKLFPAYIILGLGVALLIQLHAALRKGMGASALRPALAFLGGGALSLLTIAPLLLRSRSFLDYIMRRGTYSSVGGMNVWFAAPLLSGGDGTGGAGSGVPFNTILLLLGIALALLEDSTSFLSAVQIGITLIGIVTGVYSGATLAAHLDDVIAAWGVPMAYAEEFAFATIVVVITFVTLILGELVPKRIALENAEGLAILVAPVMRGFSLAMTPFVWLLRGAVDVLLKLVPVPAASQKSVTEDDVRAMIAEGTRSGVFLASEKRLIEGVLALADQRIGAVMVPRQDIVWLDLDEPLPNLWQEAK